jgi:hypothetical protein
MASSTREASDPPDERLISGAGWMAGIGHDQTHHSPGPTSALGPRCVKTRTSRECAEFLSLFSSFDGDCQSGSFLIQRNRDKLSARKFDVGVFTQPGSKPEKLNASKCFPLFTQQRTSPRYFGMSVSCPTTDIQADLGGLILHSQPRGRARNLSKLEASGSSERQAASALTSVPLAVILTEPSGWIRLEL